jgi:large repetitive protein
VYQHQDDIATFDLGDRQYVPALGRFLSCDPVPNSNANAYNYPNDPINSNDLSGDMPSATQNGTTYINLANPSVAAADTAQTAANKKAIAAGERSYSSRGETSSEGKTRSTLAATSGVLSLIGAVAGFAALACAAIPGVGEGLEVVSLAANGAAAVIDCGVLHDGATCGMDLIGLVPGVAGLAAGRTADAMLKGAHAAEDGASGWEAAHAAGGAWSTTWSAAAGTVGLGEGLR